jgi:YVTN family beta-propeller protein
LYVTNYNAGTISVISGSTNKVIAVINPLGGLDGIAFPIDIAFDSANDNMYVAAFIGIDSLCHDFCSYFYGVAVISGSTNKMIAVIDVDFLPIDGIAFDSANGNMYTANSGSNTVSVISGSTNTVIGTIPVGNFPHSIAFDSANGNMYTANRESNTVSVISGSTNTVIGTIPVGVTPTGIAFDSANGNIYVANMASNTVLVISTTGTIADAIPPDTIITSAVDGNGATIQNGVGATVSNSIKISFTGTDNVRVAGFQCSLDGQTAASCTTPVSFNNLAVGTHTFQVRAIDTSKNVDPTPAVFKWTILTPAQGIQQLLILSQSMNLNPAVQAMITGLLNSAANILSDNNPTNDRAACNMLNTLIIQLNLRTQHNQISPSQAAQLIQSSPYSLKAIEKAQGCTTP